MKRGKLEISVSVGEQDTGSGYDAKDCELISQAFGEAARAIRAKEFGSIIAINRLGTRVADIIIGHSAFPDRWYTKIPVIKRFK